MKIIGILGAGTWGTALANCLTNIGHKVTVWSKFESECFTLNESHRHPNLPGVEINESIVFTSSIFAALRDAEIVIFATPSIFIRETAISAKAYLNPSQIIVTVAKGIEQDTFFTMTEILEDVLGNEYSITALSGPTHAEEVSRGIPSTIVSAGKDLNACKIVQKAFEGTPLRVYTNTDVLGVEICGALKNIIALAAGISEGLGYGDNAKAAIITRGLAEITRLGLAMGAEEGTFAGLSGIGDIVVTAISNHSRNHNAGVLFGQGYRLDYVLEKIGMVVEGINALDAAKQLEEKYQVELPIIDMVYLVVKKEMDVQLVVPALFGRKKKNELKKYN